MTIETVPHFTFPGNARQAMEFYHSVFGGELRTATYGEFNVVPKDDPRSDWLMHAQIAGGLFTLAAADYDERLAPTGTRHTIGNHLSLSLWGDDLDEGRRYFSALSEGGSVTLPFEKQVWGDTYGELTDKFGNAWSVNVHEA